MTLFFFFENFRYLEEYTAFLNISEDVVDSRTEEFHGRAEAHVSVDEGRDIAVVGANQGIKNLVVFLERSAVENVLDFRGQGTGLKRVDGSDEVVLIFEIPGEESEDKVATFGIEVRIHRDLSEEVLYFGIHHSQGTESVPKVVESEQRAVSGFGGLIFGNDERASEFNCRGEVFPYEFFGEIEHVGRGDAWDSVPDFNIFAEDEAIAAEDFVVLGVPDDQLLARGLHEVELVDVAIFAGSTAGIPERPLPEPSDLAHGVGRIVGVYDINFIVGFVCVTQETFRRQFLKYKIPVNGFYNGSHSCHEVYMIYAPRLTATNANLTKIDHPAKQDRKTRYKKWCAKINKKAHQKN